MVVVVDHSSCPWSVVEREEREIDFFGASEE
jgi:hypothetical protein